MRTNSSTSTIVLILALVATGCVDTEAPAISGDDIGAGEANGAGTPRVVAVSITDSGMMMPSLQAGPTTFAIANDGGEDCILTMVLYDADGTPQDADEQPTSAERALSGATPGTPPPSAGADGGGRSAASGGEQDGAVAPARTRGSTSQRAAARRATTLTMDLQPGTYEISCADASGQAQRTSRTPMFIVVTDEGVTTSGAGGVSPSRGVTTPTDGMQGNDTEHHSTPATGTPSGAPADSDGLNR